LPWWLLCGASACYAIGNVIWFYYQVLAPDSQTFPGPADVCYVLVVPFAIGAMLTLPNRPLTNTARARALADGAIVGASLLFISWILVVGPLAGQLGKVSWVYAAVYLYYPLTDIVVVVIASGLALRASGRERLPMLLVAAGFVAIGCADTGISYLALNGREAAGSGLDLGWTVGYMLLGLAALAPWSADPADSTGVDPRALARELTPYVPVAAVLVVTATSPGRLRDETLVAIAVAIGVLVIIRHLLTLSENVRLRAHLEDVVHQRTRELEQLTRSHRSILDGAGEGIVGLDRSGVVTFANPAAGALLGRSPEAMVGVLFHDVARPRDPDGFPTSIERDPVTEAVASGHGRVVAEGTYRRAGGKDFPVELTVAPVRGPDDDAGAVLMFRDVTERRAVEELKDEFVSVVSHELRTPLTSLRGALGLLQGGLLHDVDPRAQRMVQIAVESTDRLIRLINDILDVERIAAGKLTLHRQVVQAGDLAGRAVAEMRGLASEHGVRVEIGDTTGAVEADADRMVQTLANLLSNAIKFSPAAGTVRVTAVDQQYDVLFTVSDEGAGIPADQLETIFGKFAQLDASDDRIQQGSGLGLAICRGIVEQHGGRIWAVSGDGLGATLCFTLPRVETQVEHEAPYGGHAAPTVLVCEDDAHTRAVMCELLVAHGYRVVGAASGEQALTLASETVPDAVLMDLSLPGMDGWSAIATLRSWESTRHVPVLIVSGSDPGSDPGRAPVDVEAWLTKPLDLSRLVSTVTDAVAAGATRSHVLVVEDDASLRHVLAAMLAEHGVQAAHASTAKDALQLTRKQVPDLLLLDLLLPDNDGFALVDWLREDPRLCHVPLVVYSALELDEAKKERLRLGPTEFFTKARHDPEEVERQVLSLLDTMIAGAAR